MLLASFPRPLLKYPQQTSQYGQFVMEPLPRGYGHTLGYSLQQTLLSRLPGIAVTALRIDRASHELASLPGVAEKVAEIILNLKELAVQGPTDTPREWRVHLSASGPREIKAGDLDWPKELKIVNPELHVATLKTSRARLEMDLRLATGVGYVPAERHDLSHWEAGTIPVDAIFSPVRRATYQVEATRVGHETNFDRLTLEIWTDGTCFPEETLRQAALTLIQSVQIFIEGDLEPLDLTSPETDKARDKSPHPTLDIPIEDLDFSRRTYNCLKKEQIHTLAQLISKSKVDLERIRGFGERSLEEVIGKLQDRGLTLRE